MTNDPLDILAPNYMGDTLANRGVESLSANLGVEATFANKGKGVMETNPKAMADKEKVASPAEKKDQRRTASARQFGQTKQTVGF